MCLIDLLFDWLNYRLILEVSDKIPITKRVIWRQMRWKSDHEYTVRIWKAMVLPSLEFLSLNSSGHIMAKSDKKLEVHSAKYFSK
jgi:hypothetical protein